MSRSARLQEALTAYPRAYRDRLEVTRESVLARLNFLRRMRSLAFLGKLGAFALCAKYFWPSLYPLPPRFLVARPRAAAMRRFWPLYAHTAVYFVVQRMLGYAMLFR